MVYETLTVEKFIEELEERRKYCVELHGRCIYMSIESYNISVIQDLEKETIEIFFTNVNFGMTMKYSDEIRKDHTDSHAYHIILPDGEVTIIPKELLVECNS